MDHSKGPAVKQYSDVVVAGFKLLIEQTGLHQRHAVIFLATQRILPSSIGKSKSGPAGAVLLVPVAALPDDLFPIKRWCIVLTLPTTPF